MKSEFLNKYTLRAVHCSQGSMRYELGKFYENSLYLVRLKLFEWVKFHRRHLHQILGNLAGRNFVTDSRVNLRLVTHARMQT